MGKDRIPICHSRCKLDQVHLRVSVDICGLESIDTDLTLRYLISRGDASDLRVLLSDCGLFDTSGLFITFCPRACRTNKIPLSEFF